MSEQQLKAFMELLKSDKSLQQKLKAGTDDLVVTIAKQAGFVISAEALSTNELSDEELEGVSGGNLIGSIACANFCLLSNLMG